jgi:NADH-quinone oxidoreductase subunit J
MNAATPAFWVLAVGAVVSALAVVAARDLMRASLAMIAHFLVTAALYVLLQAPFVAMAQVIVYAGAIMVLFLFVVMLLGAQEAGRAEPIGRQRLAALAGLAVLAGVLVFVVSEGVPAAAPGTAAVPLDAAEEFGSTGQLADLLFRSHVLPFEIVSVLLLVAIIGAVVLARPDRSADAAAPGADEREAPG